MLHVLQLLLFTIIIHACHHAFYYSSYYKYQHPRIVYHIWLLVNQCVYIIFLPCECSRPLLWMAIYCVMTYFHINASTKTCCRMFSNIKVWFNDDINKFYLLRCRDAMAGVAYSCIIQIRMPMKLEHHYSISSCVARNDVSFYATSFLLFILDVGLMQWYEFTKPNISTNLSAASSPGTLEKRQRYLKDMYIY